MAVQDEESTAKTSGTQICRLVNFLPVKLFPVTQGSYLFSDEKVVREVLSSPSNVWIIFLIVVDRFFQL